MPIYTITPGDKQGQVEKLSGAIKQFCTYLKHTHLDHDTKLTFGKSEVWVILEPLHLEMESVPDKFLPILYQALHRNPQFTDQFPTKRKN